VAEAWAAQNSGKSIWSNKTVRFLDPFTKSGVFLREITKRLTEGLAEELPDLGERVDHILTNQVFGIAITELTALLARRSVYCSKYADGKHSVAKSFETSSGNIWFERTEHSWTGGKCKHCGASNSEYLRSEQQETHAYALIHSTEPQLLLQEMFGESMHFDVIIGNPPYQLDDGGFGSSAAPIYHKFVEQAKNLEPRLLSMVIPARWYAGGKGLSDFRNSMLADSRIRVIHDFPDTTDVFPGVNIRGGICYFLWDRDSQGDVEVHTHEKGETTSVAIRPLVEPGLDTFIRYNEGIEILRKVIAVEGGSTRTSLALQTEMRFSEIVSSRKPFGLDTTFRGRSKPGRGDLLVYRNGGVCYAPKSELSSGLDLVDEVKIFVPYASPGSDDYPHLVLSRPIIAGPAEVATETYLAVGPFTDEAEARNVATYMGTTFFRFMLTLLRVSQHVTRNVYSLVPLQDYSRGWTDQDLADRYGFLDSDLTFMRRFVKPVAWENEFG
jgi:site-specific DNA-methyltransferase (adenine-specific)